jgi:magnesium-transporting ATPase (P-type)
MPTVSHPAEKELLSWTAPSRPHKPLDKQLFSVGLVISILISIILVFAGEFISILVIFSLVFVYYAWSTQAPENTIYSITSLGLRIGTTLYTWDQFTRWWVTGNLINFEAPLERFRRVFAVTSSEITHDQLTKALIDYLPEDQPAPTQLDKATSWLTRTFPLNK